jgi:hypothetical protein
MLSGLLAPCMRHVRQPYAAGFLQRSRLRFDMAVHWAALCFVTLGSGMLNSAEYVDRGEEGKGRWSSARLRLENRCVLAPSGFAAHLVRINRLHDRSDSRFVYCAFELTVSPI